MKLSLTQRILTAALLLLFSRTGAVIADDAPLQISITTHLGDKQEFREGDRVQFLLNLNRDAFLLLIYQDAQGTLTELVPNGWEKTGFHKAARYLSVPDSRLPFEFIAGKPFGAETVWAFAADQPFPVLDGVLLQNGLRKLSQPLDAVFARLERGDGKAHFVAAHVGLTTHATH